MDSEDDNMVSESEVPSNDDEEDESNKSEREEVPVASTNKTLVDDSVIRFEPSDVVKVVKSKVWKYFYFKGTTSTGPERNRVYCNLCKEQAEIKWK